MIETLGQILKRRQAETQKNLTEGFSLGPWTYHPQDGVAEHTGSGYWVCLYELKSSATALDWIAQIAHKTWCTDEALGQFVRMVNTILPLQENLCGEGRDHFINAKEVIAARTR